MSDLPNPLVFLGVGSSFALSGLFYHLYQEKREKLQTLKKVPFFRPDEHLVRLLNTSSHKRLLYAAVEGCILPDGEPLASQFVPRCFGVIQKIAVEEHWKYWNSLTRTWNSRRTNRKETNNTVPFSLVSPRAFTNDLYVKVQNPMEASGWYLERVHHRVRYAEESLANVMLEGLSGEKPVGQEESEELLRVGATVTGFGEIVLEGGNVMRLQAPLDGRPYILVPTDYESYMSRQESVATMWKSLSAVCGITGTSLLVGAIYSFVKKREGRSI